MASPWGGGGYAAAASAAGADMPEAAARQAVADILSAGDHYAALRAPRDAAAEELRRCYLRASMQVHPDKNKHPDATRAFQRVAAAWAVLGNPEARRTYDAKLLSAACRGRPPEDDSDDDLLCGFDGPDVTAEQAFAAFAFAVASGFAAGAGAGGSGAGAAAASEVAEALFWAQQLGSFGPSPQLHQAFPWQQQPTSSQQSCDEGAHPMFPQCGVGAPELAVLYSGTLVSAGLFTAGVVASCLGLPLIGRGARRMALMQGAAQVVMAAQLPPVRVRLASAASAASRRAREFVGDARRTGRELHDDLWSGALRTRLAERLADLDVTGRKSCLPWGRPEEAPHPCGLPVGAWVKLRGMRKAVELEGRIGELLAFHSGSGRYQVRLFPRSCAGRCCSGRLSARVGDDGDETSARRVLVKESNLRPAVEVSQAPPKEELDFI